MLNVMEERDIQIRGYVLRLPLDVLVVASANPEDYTNRGRIITPLKDRFGAEIRTHYPVELDDEVAVIRQEAHLVAEVPDHLVEILARFTRKLRESSSVDQRSGVSARFAIAGAETIAAAALHRATSAGRGRGGRPGRRPRDRRRRARRQDRVRDRRGGPRARDPRPPAAHRHRRDGAPPLPRHRLRAARRRARGRRAGHHRRAGHRPRLPHRPAGARRVGAVRRRVRPPRRHATTASGPARSSSRSRGSTSPARSARSPTAGDGLWQTNRRTAGGQLRGDADDRAIAPLPLRPVRRRPGPARAPGRHRRGAGRDRPGRDGRLLAGAGDAGVPAPRRARPDRPRRPRPPGRREAARAAAAAQPRRHPRGGARAARPAPCSRSASSSPATSTMDDADRAFREMQLENLPVLDRGRGERAVRLRLAVAARRARTTSRSRTCSAASCSTSGSPA